jgi:hypothetical protein
MSAIRRSAMLRRKWHERPSTKGSARGYESPQSLFQWGLAADSSTDRPADAIVARLFGQKLRQPGQGSSTSLTSRRLLTRTPWASREDLVDDLSQDRPHHENNASQSFLNLYAKHTSKIPGALSIHRSGSVRPTIWVWILYTRARLLTG